MNLDAQLPSFEEATEWLNRKPSSGQETKINDSIARTTRGRPTLVHFWSINNDTSKNNLTQVAELRDQRKREGLRVIAIHVPESEEEKNPQPIISAIARLNLTELCALDNDLKLRDLFLDGQTSVPAYYLFD